MSYLSSRNAALEEENKNYPDFKQEYEELQQKCDLLLTLLGEKEEELEGLTGDIKEVKTLYRDQLDSLFYQLTDKQSQ